MRVLPPLTIINYMLRNNARSVMNKRDDLKALLSAHQPDIVAVTETFLDEEINDPEIVSNSYTVFRRDRNRHGGGVMALVKDSVSATHRADLENSSELIWIEISHSTKTVLLGVFYRPPSSDLAYLTNLQNSLLLIPDTQDIILCGDFNAPNINWNLHLPITPSRISSLLCDISRRKTSDTKGQK